jgi:hypothetical protein
MKLDRISALSPLEREKLTNSALEVYDFIIGSLLQAEMPVASAEGVTLLSAAMT